MSLESRIRKIEAKQKQRHSQTYTVMSGSVAEGMRLTRELQEQGLDVITLIFQGLDPSTFPPPLVHDPYLIEGVEVDELTFPEPFHIEKSESDQHVITTESEAT